MAQGLRQTWVRLLRRPGQPLLVVVMLALGIGGNTAVFSLLDSLVLAPLPFEQPEQLVSIGQSAPELGLASVPIDYADFHAWRRDTHRFDSLALTKGAAFNLARGDRVVRVEALGVTHDLARVLRIRPALGRMFTPLEDSPAGPTVAILAHDLWQELFGGDPGALGSTLRLDGKDHTVVGVLPADLRMPSPARLWVPIAADPDRVGNYRFTGLGRLKPGATPDAARRDLDRVLEARREAYPLKRSISPRVTPFRDQLAGETAATAWRLMAAVALVLAVACVNVAALQLARGAGRVREMAIRTALGARRSQLVPQLLAESLLLAIAGSALGIALGTYALGALGVMAARELPFWVTFTPRPGTLALCLAAGVATTLLFGVFPALLSTRVSGRETTLPMGGGSTRGPRRGALSGLVVGEVALVQALLIAAGLVLMSQRELLRVDPGYRPGNVLSFGVSLPEVAYAEGASRLSFFRELRRDLQALPGVESVAFSTNLPLQSSDRWFFEAEGAAPAPPGSRPAVLIRQSSDGYAATMGIPVLRGRELGPAATRSGELNEVLVDESFARVYWPGEDPVGRRVRTDPEAPWLTVVGVCRSVRHDGPERAAPPGVYLPISNHPPGRVSFVLRTRVAPESLVASARAAVVRLDPELPLYDVGTLEQQLAGVLGLRRLVGWLFGSFAAVGLILGAGGVFGVVSYLVSQRTPELGLRAALGATAHGLLGLVLRQGARLALLGTLLGVLAALLLGGALEGLLFGVDSRDPRVFAASGLLLFVVALGANLLPALRAARVEPMRALRVD